MLSGKELVLLVALFLILFSFVPGVMGSGGSETWKSSLSVFGTRVSSVNATLRKDFTLNGALLGSQSLSASAPANMSGQSSSTTSFSAFSTESSLNLTFSWTIDPSLFRAGYWERVCATGQISPSGYTFWVVCSYSFILGASGTSWESNLTVYSPRFPVTSAQGVVNYTWALRGTRIGSVGLIAIADPNLASAVKNTTLSMSPTDTSVSLTLRLNYTMPASPTTFWAAAPMTFLGGEGNGGTNLGSFLTKLTDSGIYQAPAASSVFPSVLLSLSLAAFMTIPLILSYRCRRRRSLSFAHMF